MDGPDSRSFQLAAHGFQPYRRQINGHRIYVGVLDLRQTIKNVEHIDWPFTEGGGEREKSSCRVFRAHLDHIRRNCTVATHFESRSCCCCSRCLWALFVAHAATMDDGIARHRSINIKIIEKENDNDDDTQKSVRRTIKIAHKNRRSGLQVQMFARVAFYATRGNKKSSSIVIRSLR